MNKVLAELTPKLTDVTSNLTHSTTKYRRRPGKKYIGHVINPDAPGSSTRQIG